MSNKYSEQFLSLDPVGTCVSEVSAILNYFGLYVHHMQYHLREAKLEEQTDIKATLVCLLAAMSDEDIVELKLTPNLETIKEGIPL